ncbi:MAG: hypothetical protein ACLGH0_00575 [Thermoanaerobaculia bacterium]
MSRRNYVFAAVALAAASLLHADDAADRECTRATIARPAALHPQLANLAAPQPGEEIVTEKGVFAAPGAFEIVVARIGTDGKVALACVDDREAANRILTAEKPRMQPKQAQEQ